MTTPRHLERLRRLCTWRDRAFRAAMDSHRRLLRHVWPETGGTGLYVHNWYRCGSDPIVQPIAEALCSAEFDRWHRADRRFDRWFAALEHERHDRDFAPRWCAHCHPSTPGDLTP